VQFKASLHQLQASVIAHSICSTTSEHEKGILQRVLQQSNTFPKQGLHVATRFLGKELSLTDKAKNSKLDTLQSTASFALKQRYYSTKRGKFASLHCFHPLPIQQFQSLLTLFPKSLSSFPHGTCALLVSNTYEALDEAYHPLCAPIPRNVTLKLHAVHKGLQTIYKDSHLHWCSVPRGLYPHPCWQCVSTLHIRAIGSSFHAGLFPVHSPLLRKSCLVLLPPLTYMLKFSGSADLRSCQMSCFVTQPTKHQL